MRTLIFFLIVFLTSCSVLDKFTTKEFNFSTDEKSQKVILEIPRGFKEEKFLVSNKGGKEQYYYYDNGSLMYIARLIDWDTENQPMIEKSPINTGDKNLIVYKGIDKDGLHWKEIRFDEYKLGYSYVPHQHLETFEEAINSIRIK